MIGFALNGVPYFYQRNLQGDVTGIYDLDGNVVVCYTYDAWGNVLSIAGSAAATVGEVNPIRYRGRFTAFTFRLKMHDFNGRFDNLNKLRIDSCAKDSFQVAY